MIDQTQAIEVHEELTPEQLHEIERLGARKLVVGGNAVFTWHEATPNDACAYAWGYLCDQHVKATLVTTTRVTNFEAPA